MKAEDMYLLYYCPSRWHLLGNVLFCTLELRQEMYGFLLEEKHEYADTSRRHLKKKITKINK